MTTGMTSTKIAVSLPSELVAQAKLDDLALLLAEMLAESGGPLTAAERKVADVALGR